MAVTGLSGEGTNMSPYQISSYEELQYLFHDIGGGYSYSYTGIFAELTNDIDCTEYGGKFRWNTLSRNNNNAFKEDRNGDGTPELSHPITKIELDLKNFSIKTFKTGYEQSMFIGKPTSGHSIGAEEAWDKETKNERTAKWDMNLIIKNGKILNVYGHNTDKLFAYCDFRNIAFSIDIDEISIPFWRCRLTKCSLYVRATKARNNPIFYYSDGHEMNTVEEAAKKAETDLINLCDFWFDFSDGVYTKTASYLFYTKDKEGQNGETALSLAYGKTWQGNIVNSRFRGNWGKNWMYLSNMTFKGCLMAATWAAPDDLGAVQGDLQKTSIFGWDTEILEDQTCVYAKDKFTVVPATSKQSGWEQLDYEDMKDKSKLDAVLFYVTDKNAATS